MEQSPDYDRISRSLRELMISAVGSLDPCTLALSGGLDSSIIAALRAGGSDTHCISIVSSDFGAPDMTYSQAVARKAGLPLEIVNADINGILDGADRTVKALGNFNTIEIRNATVMHLVLCAARSAGADLVVTGDGADELFGGYSFLVGAPEGQLRSKLDRLQRIMHFPSMKLAESMGMKTHSPYLDPAVVELSRTISDDLLVGNRGGERIGKWILRKTFEGDIPDAVAWRKKVPMSQGSGLDGLGGFLDRIVPDSVFEKERDEILERDGVRIRDKESLHYYKVYREEFGVPARAPADAPKCPDCHSDTSANDGRFCRMCGRFPI